MLRNTYLKMGLLAICLCLGLHMSAAAVSVKQPGLLPAPQSVKWGKKAVPLSSVRISFKPGKSDPLKVDQLNLELKELLAQNNVLVSEDETGFPLVLKLGKVDVPRQEDEAYQLVVNRRGITVEANTVKGLYYGVQTLRQLIVSENGKATVAACEILDYPAFKIRGFMHDVGRNFQTLELLKEQVDIMAAYKLNIFHWHLTEYYGWRLESKIHPKLTAKSSATRYPGEYYSQKEFKEFLDYCWARNIIVIPEFDSPGHSDAFRKGIGVDRMSDPKAKKAMVELLNELCRLAPAERMPYIHLGTDEVRGGADRVGADYLPALNEAVRSNDREVIGWWKGMAVPGDALQIQQTWAKANPRGGNRHIDSRSNYINHMEALDLVPRMMFQQPCRQPYGDDIHLGGILCYWPDNRIADEQVGIRNSPVLLSMVAYSEGVWKGIEQDRPEYWAKVPPADTSEYAAVVDFENRLAEQRDRFLSDKPFLFVKTANIPWRLLGPVAAGELPDLEEGEIKKKHGAYRWSDPVYGGAIHVKHFFGFQGHLNSFPKGKDVVWAHTYVYSPKRQKVDAWINFNTTSTSDNRAGVADSGDWNKNTLCDIWINNRPVPPPKWENPGQSGKEFPFTNEIYTSREPTKIQLKRGWNKVLIRTAPTWKWVFTFAPIEWDGMVAREVEGLRFSIDP